MNQEEIIRQAINYALSKKSGNTIFWNNDLLALRELYKYLLSQPGFKSFSAPSEFENYVKYNIRKFNLFGCLDLTIRTKSSKFAEAEEIIEKYNYCLVPEGITPNDYDYVVRTKMGNGRVRFYDNGKLSIHQLNVLKTAYAMREGVKYIDVRPCLYKNWINWSDERQQASYRDELNFIF